MSNHAIALKRVFALLLVAGFLFSASSFAATNFVQAQSSHSFNSTVSQLKHAISGNGMMVMGHIDQANVLKMTGLHLKGAESFLVGNPKVGKKLFKMSPAAGAVLPLRMYVWEKGGQTYVGYFQPSDLLTAVDSQFRKPGQMMDKKFHMILKGATQ
ncbi:DUF302 domain-containing protein [Salinisphaera sp. LB1]|uniref:DUF302 domain-containing protein n=1 Tax=Salinisphaera sp. LB1 TaxID=2183911 RepID=UPI000D7EADF8|nr:DUF302 domain-containing protein [Salinisphaera sp. LB1]AWN14448.1 hypothetical protein SALB1_0241 [Salinisphaera sp. LB1]